MQLVFYAVESSNGAVFFVFSNNTRLWRPLARTGRLNGTSVAKYASGACSVTKSEASYYFHKRVHKRFLLILPVRSGGGKNWNQEMKSCLNTERTDCHRNVWNIFSTVSFSWCHKQSFVPFLHLCCGRSKPGISVPSALTGKT